MWETSSRLLKLLSLLQMPRSWPAGELADRLGITTRTVRRDVDRLRELGYPVHATQGTPGYQLGAGAAMPPLLLDDEEAVAVTVGLRTAAGGTVTGIEETALRALTKIEQVLPSRLRYRVGTLHAATIRAGVAPVPRVSAETLMSIAEACRRTERLRFDYTSHDGGESSRSVEPHNLVNFGRHWYLVGFDVDQQDWRTFRVDRLHPRLPTGPRFTPRPIPHGDAATYLSYQLSQRSWAYQATVRLHVPAEVAEEKVWPGMGVLEAVDADNCLLHLGAPVPADLQWMITSVGVDFTLVSGPRELTDALRAQASRCLRAIEEN